MNFGPNVCPFTGFGAEKAEKGQNNEKFGPNRCASFALLTFLQFFTILAFPIF